MILKSFILGNLVSLCMKIINSVVVVGLYYGFLTTFSIGPSYLFLLRARVMEEGEEGTEKKVSATTGFITGQLMMFISIYYAPLHLALGRPHTITVLALPYLLFHFFWNNHKHFFDYGPTTRNSMRNLSIQCLFLNNLIFQLFNHFILPSSMLVRLVNIYMFRCNNKMLFVTSSFVGWLIGHILFMKWVGLVLGWIQQNNSIRSNVLIRSNKYLVSELRNSMARIFSILLFITCVYYLGRIPSPIITKKLKETSETEERGESEEETDGEIETTSETKGTKQEQEGSTAEDPSPSLFSEEKEDPDKIDETEEIRVNEKEKTKDEFYFKETRYKNKPVYETYYLDGNQEQENLKLQIFTEKKDLFRFEKPVVTILFDPKRWNRPLRYIKNNRCENAVRTEMSQYFFFTCQSDGKERITFTYPPSLATFLEMMQRKTSLFQKKKVPSIEFSNKWGYINEQKQKKISKIFINRVKTLDTKSVILNILEKRTRLCNDKTKKEYLPKIYDPFLNGSYRGQIKKLFSLSIKNEISQNNSNYIEKFLINKIHSIFLIINHLEFEQKRNPFDRKTWGKQINYLLNLMDPFSVKSTSNVNLKNPFLVLEHEQIKIDSEDRIKMLKFLFDADTTLPDEKTIKKKSNALKEIHKKVPRWSYKLINDLEQQVGEGPETVVTDHEIRSRKAKRVVIFTDTRRNTNRYSNTQETNNTDQTDEVALIRYSQQSDFRRDIIKGSVRAQRRKIVNWKFFEADVHSPLFLDRIDKSLFFSFAISERIKRILRNCMWTNTELKILDYKEKTAEESEKKKAEDKKEETKKNEKVRIEIAEAWDSILLAQAIRGFLLITQSILRKYIILPSLIIVKNIARMLLLQFPEWSEDFKDWNREMYVKCTYNGVQLSEKEFPKNWLTDGIQIKILFPFRLKPWHRSNPPAPYNDTMKKKDSKNSFCFLTVFGMETEFPFGSPRKQLSFFEPIFKELKRKIRKLKKKCFRILRILKEKTKSFLNVSKKTKKWVIKRILFLKEIKKELSKKNPILLFELSKTKKDSTISNLMIPELSSETIPLNWTNYSLTEKKMQDLTDRTNTIINQIETITNEKRNVLLIPDRNINSNKIKDDDKRLESKKKIWPIVKRKNARLIRKSHYFIKIFIERIYIDIFLWIFNISRINTQPFVESIKEIFFKYITNNETNQEKIDKTNQSLIHFISNLKRTLYNTRNNNSKTFCDLSYFSQAYVFYKLSRTKILKFDFYKFKSVFQYNEATPFIKKKIKGYFVGIQELFHSQLKHKNRHNSGIKINQWTNWLRNHYQYQYDISQIRWSRLVPHKWRNGFNQYCMNMNQNKDLCNPYKKTKFMHYEKQNYFEIASLLNEKENFKKQYRYDLLAYKYINSEDTKSSSIYESSLHVKNNQEIFSNSNTTKLKSFYMIEGIPINNDLVQDDIKNTEKNLDRKYFDWRIIRFCLRNRMDIKVWISMDIDQNSKKTSTKTKFTNYQTIEKITKKNTFSLAIHQEINVSNKKPFLDWMGMNEEILNRPISNLERWFFPEFLIFYNLYKTKPWVIPIKLLLLDSNINENDTDIENKTIVGNKKRDSFILLSSNEKKSLELKKRNKGQKESANQANLESVLSNQQKDVEADYTGSDMKKHKNKKQYKNNTKTEFDFLLKRYFHFQLRWDDILNKKIINNIKVYCLLLRLINPREITISSIQRGEMSLDILMIQKNLTLTELIKRGILIIEPIRLSIKNNEQFIMYQTIGISLVQESKQKINQNYREKTRVDKNSDEVITKYKKMTGNRHKNHYDLFVPENLLSPRLRREFRILICFNSRNRKDMSKNSACGNENKVNSPFLDKSKGYKKKLIKLKLVLWPNYRLEDLACMNRYWFDSNNGSRFSMVRIHIYPRLKIHY
uniref:Protein TIC 214 n=2 Tax=Bencomia TaxID=137432 RepID=A0A3G4S6H3_9ROSA|nr:Ycf1 [Bencomia exstipulata]AYU74370.1 Ycf1 [Bencomia exstipulata]